MPQPKQYDSGGLDATQWQNAVLIYRVGKRMGMSQRDIQIALITALQESSLRNLNYGDGDSLGLFQQTHYWGTPAQRMDPVYSAQKFYAALKGLGQRRYNLSMTQAAQAVQRSAYPNAYAAHIPLVRSIFPSLASRAGDPQRNIDGQPYHAPAPAAPASVWVAPTSTVDPTASALSPTLDGQVPYGYGTPDLTPPTLSATVPSVLAADYGFNMDPQIPGSDNQAWQTFLGAGTNQQILDQAAANGTYTHTKGVNGWRAEVLNAAKSALGTPYVWGGNSLQNGVDCSGLVQQAFAKAGIRLPRVSYMQASSGKRVPISALRPGDLVAWNYRNEFHGGADHIAIYLGNGQIIEAARPGTSVRIRKLGRNEGAWGVLMTG